MKSCGQPCPAAPWASLALHHKLLTLGLWGSVQRNGLKNKVWPAEPTLERQEMSWMKWICRAGAAEVQHPAGTAHTNSTTPGRFLLCISWWFSIFFANFNAGFIAKFRPLRMKVCNPCVILKNCLKIRSSLVQQEAGFLKKYIAP